MTTRPGAAGLLRWWPLLIAPAGMIFAFVLARSGPPAWLGRVPQEYGAIAITGTAVVCALAHWLCTRDRLYVLLFAGATTVMCRELHWGWTTVAVYVSLAVLGVLGFAWRSRLVPYIDRRPPIGVFLIATAFAYVLSQLMARRVFRFLPEEETHHSKIEEFMENIAHAMLLVTILVGPWRRRSAPS